MCRIVLDVQQVCVQSIKWCLVLTLVVKWLEEGPRSLSSLKKEFSKETKIVKKIKAFIRSIVCVEEHMGRLGVSYPP